MGGLVFSGLQLGWLGTPKIIFTDSPQFSGADEERAVNAVRQVLSEQKFVGQLSRPTIFLNRAELVESLSRHPDIKAIGDVEVESGPGFTAELVLRDVRLRHELPGIEAVDGIWTVEASGALARGGQSSPDKKLWYPSILSPYESGGLLGNDERKVLTTWLYDTRLPWPVLEVKLLPVYTASQVPPGTQDGTPTASVITAPLAEAQLQFRGPDRNSLPVKVFISLKDGMAEKRLQSFFSSNNVDITKLAYIDLRYGDRVFVCVFNQACNRTELVKIDPPTGDSVSPKPVE